MLKVKMTFISCLIVLCFCFVEINCKSIHAHDDFHSGFDINRGKTLNHRHDNKSQVSWIKLKPILRREIHHAGHVEGAESTVLSAETTHQVPTKNEEKSRKILDLEKHEEISSQISNNEETDMVKSNLTFLPSENDNILEEYASNDTNTEYPDLDSPLKKNDFPYNITPDTMNQSGDLIVFLALNENGSKIDSSDSDETSLINEGTTIILEDISTTGLEILRDFESQQNLIEIKFPIIETALNDENNLTNMTKGLHADTLEINRGEDRQLFETTEDTVTITGTDGIGYENSYILNAEKTLEVPIRGEDDYSQESLNVNNFTEFKLEENSSTISSSTKSEIIELGSSYNKLNSSAVAVITADEIRTKNTETDLANSFKSDEQSEVVNKRQKESKCPDPGLCIFWFLSFDTCDEDSHCHGSLICCMWGCSKMCIDGDAVIP